jgi:hypothetical protein
MLFVNSKRLNNSAGAAITALAMANTVVTNSEAIKVDRNVGFFVLTVKEDKVGGAGDVDIYVEYSDDATTWYRSYTSDLAGSITVEGNIVTTLQNVTRRISFTARLAKYVRFVFDPDADSQITADLTYQEEL